MRKRLLAFIVSVVMMFGVFGVSVVGAGAPAPSFNLVIDVLEWGSAATAVVIDLGHAITERQLDGLSIEVSAVMRNPIFIGAEPDFSGAREITAVYLSNTADIEHSLIRRNVASPGVAIGRYVVVELVFGFNNTAGQVNGSEASRWIASAPGMGQGSRNYWLLLDYTVIVDGVEIPYSGTVRPIYDDFDFVVGVGEFATQQYRLYTPRGATGPLPLVLWNHGGGETFGTHVAPGIWYQNILAENRGAELFANMGGIGWVLNAPEPAFVLAPQRGAAVPGGYSREGVIAYIESLVAAGLVDADRIYVSGPSAGGGESHNFLVEFPDFFAAAVIICTGGLALVEDNMDVFTSIPLWYMQAREFGGPIEPGGPNQPGAHWHGDAITDIYHLLVEAGADIRKTIFNRVFGTELPNAFYAGSVHPSDFIPQDRNFYPNNHWSWLMVLNNVTIDADYVYYTSAGTVGQSFMDWLFEQRR